MDAIKLAAGTESGPMSIFLRGGVVMLTLLTAAIHASLGGLLFTMNAAVYLVLAVAMILPAIAPFRWLARLALLGFASATIAGWLLFGARFQLAYIDKAIELALLCFLAIEVVAVRRRAGRRHASGASPGGQAWQERSRHGAPDDQARHAIDRSAAPSWRCSWRHARQPRARSVHRRTAPPGGAGDRRPRSGLRSRHAWRHGPARPFQLLFDNRDGAPHNVTILDANGGSTFVGETFGGPASADLRDPGRWRPAPTGSGATSTRT